MKTTLEIADPLLREAKQLAARDGTTLRELVEQGLRTVVAHRRQDPSLDLKIAAYGQGGLTDAFKNATSDDWLDAMYGMRGVPDRD